MVEIIFDKTEDWENRILCSDESCIGTIGSDGRCKECGKVYEGDLTLLQNGAASIETPVQRATDPVPAEASGKTGHSEEGISDEEWETRVLCSDGSCIGTIGSDGRCKECGKPLNPN